MLGAVQIAETRPGRVPHRHLVSGLRVMVVRQRDRGHAARDRQANQTVIGSGSQAPGEIACQTVENSSRLRVERIRRNAAHERRPRTAAIKQASEPGVIRVHVHAVHVRNRKVGSVHHGLDDEPAVQVGRMVVGLCRVSRGDSALDDHVPGRQIMRLPRRDPGVAQAVRVVAIDPRSTGPAVAEVSDRADRDRHVQRSRR